MVVAEVKLIDIALKVSRADMMERTDNAALEDREVTLDSVRCNVATHIFTGGVIDDFMAGEHGRDQAVLAFAIRHQVRVRGIHSRVQNGTKVVGIDGWQMQGAHLAATFNQREHHFLIDTANGLFVALGAMAVFLFAAHIRFVRLNDLAATTKQAATVFHGFAKAMLHEPCGLVRDAKRAMHLVRRVALFACSHQVSTEHPFVKGYLAALKYRTYRYGEWLQTIFALIKTGARRLALERVMVLADTPAMRANRAIGPADCLKVYPGFVRVLVNRVC